MADEQNQVPDEVKTWVRTPVPPEIIAAIVAESQTPEAIAEMQVMLAGGGRKLADFLPELDALVAAAAAATPAGEPADV